MNKSNHIQKENKMPVAKARRLVKIGHSLYVALPKEFIKRHNLQAGEFIPVVAGEILKMVPVKE